MGFRSVPLGGSGGGVFASRGWQRWSSQAGGAGAGGELTGLGMSVLRDDTIRYHFISTTGCFTARAM